MGYIIEISEKKIDKLSNHVEESLRHLGKAMQCLDQMTEESMGERGGMGYRGDMGYRGGNNNSGGSYENRYGMGYRDEDNDWEEEQEMMNERRMRRRRDSMGRFR